MLPRTRAAPAAVVMLVAAGVSVNAVAARAPGPRTSPSEVAGLPALDARIAADINGARARHGLSPLRLSRPLSEAAAFHSYDMARYGFFSHDSHNGTSPSARLARFYPATSRRPWEIGEALLWCSGGVSAAAAVHDWLSSPAHRAILMGAGFRDIGISAVRTVASGEFTGGAITLITADVGDRGP